MSHLCQLPPNPWRNIPGIPPALAPGSDTIPRHGRSRIHIANHRDLRGNREAINEVFNLVRDFFNTTPLFITEIQHWRNVLVIVLENDAGPTVDVLRQVPASVGQCMCLYIFEAEMARPTFLAHFTNPPVEVVLDMNHGIPSTIRLWTGRPIPQYVWISCRWDYADNGGRLEHLENGICDPPVWSANEAGTFVFFPTAGPFVNWGLTISMDDVHEVERSLV